jgi:parallel beta-helix repeat protein
MQTKLLTCVCALLLGLGACEPLEPAANAANAANAAALGDASGRVLHVAADGDDAAPGTADAPLRTIQRAATLAGPGDTVLVHAGTYAGFNVEDKAATAEAPVHLRAAPDPQDPTRHERVVIDAPGPLPGRRPFNATRRSFDWVRWPHGINVQRSSHVVIEGFEVRGMPEREYDEAKKALHTGGAGIRLEASRHVTVRGNRALENGRWGIFASFCDDVLVEGNVASGTKMEHGIYLSNSGDRPRIVGNVTEDNRGAGIQINADNNFYDPDYEAFAVVDGVTTGAVVDGNQIRRNGRGGAAGINLDGVSDSTITNNLLEANLATGIALFQLDGATGSQRNLVEGNTIRMAPEARWAIDVLGCPPDETNGDRCESASSPFMPTWPRPPGRATGSTGNRIVGNVLVAPNATKGSLRTDTASLAVDPTTGRSLESNRNVVVDRFGLDAELLTLAAWRARTGQDGCSAVLPAP